MSKKPTGITISRNGGKYTVAWKCGDKNYSDGQQFQYKINKGSWVSVSIGKSTRTKSLSFNLDKYYPTTKKIFSTLSVRIRGKVNSNKSTWSDWATKTYTNYVPSVPTLTATLDSTLTNRCTFTWNLTTTTTDAKPYKNVRWETILVKESDVKDGSKLPWKSSTLGWGYGIGSSASSHTITENTASLALASYTRWFRVRARGARGASAWRYTKHVYARPYQPKVNSAKVESTSAEGLLCFVNWTVTQPASHPIDKTTVQFLITVPNENLTCPSGAQWEDANVSADTAYTDSAKFSIDNILGKDECLFVRVNTQHDSNITYGVPTLAMVGKLKDPTDLTYQTNDTNHTLTSLSVDNESEVEDSFIVIVYRSGSNPENEIAVGIIPHGASQPLVMPVQCPDWSGESEFSIGAYAAVGTYSANTDGLGYTVVAKMQSDSIWVGGAIPVAPQNVNVVQSLVAGTATVTWDWSWEEATNAQLSWTNRPDAWESTDEPEIYSIPKSRATKWNIADLETGEKWYIAVRLVNGNPDDDTAIFGPWSDPTEIILSSAPNIPSLELSSTVITMGESITASWNFESTDGTGQISAEVCEIVDTPVGTQYGTYFLSRDTTVIVEEDGEELLNGKTYYEKTGTYTYEKVDGVSADDNPVENEWYEYQQSIAHTTYETEVVIDPEALGWAEGEYHSLSVRVTSASNRTTEWSTPVSFVIAEELQCSIASTSLIEKQISTDDEEEETETRLCLDELPLTVVISGAGENTNVTLKIERTADYHMDRPDDRDIGGFKDEAVYLFTQTNDSAIVVEQDDLIGRLDDGAPYKLVAILQDVYGQTATDELEFEVSWKHQALVPDAEIVIDDENLIARITPVAPTGTLNGDACDIYRLSADRPELVISGAQFGTEYVDPYPTIGEFGGYRVVFVSMYGDYITEDNTPAWTDFEASDGYSLNIDQTIIDFDGEQLLLYYNIDTSDAWDKDTQETVYMGGSVVIDWNAAVRRSGSIGATMITITEQEQIKLLRRLAEYTAPCHVRTQSGSSYTADVTVSEDHDHDDYGKLATFSLSITKCDPESYDGMTYEEWARTQ